MEQPPSRPLADLRAEYWMIQKLGVGGFGKVYLIRHRHTREYCAAKHQKWGAGEIPRQARREVAILARLENCNNIVRFINYFEGEDQSVILTEYLQGGELFQRISSRDYALTEAKCRDFFRQILRGVEFMHAKRIIHLDLKPQNIVMVLPHEATMASALDEEDQMPKDQLSSASARPGSGKSSASRRGSSLPEDRLKIIDLGLARDLGLYADRIPITMCGTLEFMSPEVMRCSHASTASDMWSVGVILYMMLSGGVSPFWAGSEYRTQRRVIRGIYSMDSANFKDISRSALDCITKLLQVDGSARVSATRCLEDAWLTGSYLDTLKLLETKWMRKYLAKRRWQRWFNAVRAMNRMQKLAHASGSGGEAAKAKAEVDIGLPIGMTSSKERWV